MIRGIPKNEIKRAGGNGPGRPLVPKAGSTRAEQTGGFPATHQNTLADPAKPHGLTGFGSKKGAAGIPPNAPFQKEAPGDAPATELATEPAPAPADVKVVGPKGKGGTAKGATGATGMGGKS